MTNILITGGCGFIGTLLSRSLLDLGHTVISIDPLELQIHGIRMLIIFILVILNIFLFEID